MKSKWIRNLTVGSIFDFRRKSNIRPNPARGNSIKKMSAGGDKLIGRNHNEAETAFVPHFTVFCMLNDIPKIDPLDDAVYSRLVYCEFKKQFVDEVVDSKFQVQADPDLSAKIKQARFIRGFIHLILDGYKYYLKHGQPEFNSLTKEEWTINDRKDKCVADLLLQHFEITNNDNDFISVADMNEFKNKHKKEFSTISSKRFNDLIKITFKIEQTRKGTNSTRGWIGIKNKNDDILL